MTGVDTIDEAAVFGSDGLLGYIAPSTCERAVREFYAAVPPTIGMLIASLPIVEVSADQATRALAEIEGAAHRLASTGADLIYAGGLPLILAGGAAFNAQLQDRLASASGRPAVTDLSVVLQAIRALGLDRWGLVTPFSEPWTARIAEVLFEADVEVCAHRSLGLDRQIDYGKLPYGAARGAIEALLADHPETEGLYLPVGRVGHVGLIGAWEQEFGRPIITANQSMIWWALNEFGHDASATGLGRLSTVAVPEAATR